MAKVSEHRTDFAPIDGGPWLEDRSYVRVGGQLLLVSTSVGLGALLMEQGLIAGIASLGMLWALVMLGVQRRRGSDMQYCPDCLQGMTRGAVVCPWCGRADAR